MYALAKSKDDVKGREGKEKEAGNVEGKKEKEKAVIAAQHCGNYLLFHIIVELEILIIANM